MPLVSVRRARPSDAAEVSALLLRNAEHLAPFEPARPAGWASADGQRGHLETAARLTAEGGAYAAVIELDGRIVGRINLNHIVRGALRSADLGYWVSADVSGRGVATAAVRRMLGVAFGPLELHRVQAGTLVENLASQAVLHRNGFERIGLARRYLRIAGDWRDHVLYQRLVEGG